MAIETGFSLYPNYLRKRGRMVLFQKGHLFDIMAKGVGTKLWKGAYKGGALI